MTALDALTGGAEPRPCGSLAADGGHAGRRGQLARSLFRVRRGRWFYDLGDIFARRDRGVCRTGGARIAAVRAVPASAGIRQRDHLGRVKLRRLRVRCHELITRRTPPPDYLCSSRPSQSRGTSDDEGASGVAGHVWPRLVDCSHANETFQFDEDPVCGAHSSLPWISCSCLSPRRMPRRLMEHGPFCRFAIQRRREPGDTRGVTTLP
jgi:hypothetical protein